MVLVFIQIEILVVEVIPVVVPYLPPKLNLLQCRKICVSIKISCWVPLLLKNQYPEKNLFYGVWVKNMFFYRFVF